MTRLIIVLFALGYLNHAQAIYVKTYFHNEPDANNTCCIKLAHVYYTNNHQYIAMGHSVASLDAAVCCEGQPAVVNIESVSQFQKDSLDRVFAFNQSEGFQKSVHNVLLKYQLSIEGKKGKIEVTQNPESGKLVLSFTATKAGLMNLSVEPINNNNLFEDEVQVKLGKNVLEINYVPYAGKSPKTPFVTYLITLINENEVLGANYQHEFR